MNKKTSGLGLIVLVLLGIGGYSVYRHLNTPTARTITYLVSPYDTTKYCNGSDMDSTGYQKTITVERATSTTEINPTKKQIIKETIHVATTGMCQTVMDQLDITENSGVVSVPPFDGWAGLSITMRSCKPLVETNLLRIPGITKVKWSEGGDISKANLIHIQTPVPNQTITSPLVIKGEARGSWFFEASFPVVLTDWDGKIIAHGIARAESDWITNDFVPFTAHVSFTAYKNIYSNKGSLILQKDNPSGLPENDNALEIPIVFAKNSVSTIACTQEAKLCPDGSAIGRTGKNCEFAPCPKTILPFDSGVEGNITIGPTCPVMRVGDTSCNDKPYATTVQVIEIGSPKSSPFATTESDKNGTYKIMLPPGEYALQPVGGSVLPRCETKNIIITPSEITNLDLSCDSGIR
ncbi:MAG: hypothetical protein NT098_05425 [Candidatus Parcubacteria bacterium]|nr:hypothetical protein [Candidatus Parcubacteria bacterium]